MTSGLTVVSYTSSPFERVNSEAIVRISCVVVCYNQQRTIGDAILSFVQQTRPPDEILVADDASTDGSRHLILALANSHPTISPIFRERNLGVSANRDLAVRQATGDFVTTLDGDDYVRPMKLEHESAAIERTSSSIAYSTQRFVHEIHGTSRIADLPPLDRLDARERLRWLVSRRTRAPLGMLMPKAMHLEIGGYRHELRVYEDWDYKIRLVARPGTWVYAGEEGVVVRVHGRHGQGLSLMPYYRHGLAQLTVLRDNRNLLCGQLGRTFYYGAVARILVRATKWQSKAAYWRAQDTLKEILSSRPVDA